MAVSGYSSMNSQRNFNGFMTTLSSAACEWFLMFLILVYAGFSQLLTKFAWYCELETPCLLCSRLDHVFGEGPGYYRNLLCTNHREEISSTIYCHIHDKLSDLREICEECFMSTGMQNRPSAGSYKIMMGKSGMDFERGGFQSPYIRKNFLPLARACACCNKQLKTKTKAQRLLQKTPVGLGASRANVRPPLPRMPGRSRLSHRDNLRKIREKMTGSATSPCRTAAEKMMSYAGYAELKFNSNPNSESESDFPYSDDDDGSSTCQDKFEPSDSFFARLSSDYHARKGKPSSTPPPELTFPDDVTSSSNIVKGPTGVSAESLKSSLSRISSMDRLSDHVLVRPKSNATDTPTEVSPDKASTMYASQANLINETASSKDADLSDRSKTGVTNKGREVPGLLAAQDANRDSVKFDKTENLHPPVSESSSPEGIRVIKKSASSNKLDSGYESVDISIVPEIKGEDIVDRLKRQIDYDKKILSSLHKELEEERNASEISASQAMAMITKLQEEKSELRMESAQRLRIMEEQAEYDMEALNKADELLAEKEMLIQELETELEYYRKNIDKSKLGNQPGETCKRKEENKKLLNNEVVEIDAHANAPSESRSVQTYEGGEKSTCYRSSFLDFVDEKKYIAQCLRDLERKLHQVSANAASSGMLNGLHSADITDAKENTDEKESVEGNFTDREAKAEHQDEYIGISRQEDATTSHGNPSGHHENIPSVEDRHHNSEESHSDHQKRVDDGGKIDLGTLEHEISDLHERLEALEVDHEILEHGVNSLQGGNEGVQFLQEIAGHLQELRKVEFGEK